MDEFKCIKCEREFNSNVALESHNQAKHPENIPKPLLTEETKKKIKKWSIISVLVILFIGLPFYLVTNVKTLPPTSMEGHIESNPASHVLKKPMPEAIHRHMLEHADGKQGGPGGIIINYNCRNYECEEDLIENLEAFAEKYPANVYVAPFPRMDAKIVLTKLNKRKIFEEYDEKGIDDFIIGR